MMKIEKILMANENDIELEVGNGSETFHLLFEFQEWLETGNHEEPWAGLFVSVPGASAQQWEVIGTFFGDPRSQMEFAELEENLLTAHSA